MEKNKNKTANIIKIKDLVDPESIKKDLSKNNNSFIKLFIYAIQFKEINKNEVKLVYDDIQKFYNIYDINDKKIIDGFHNYHNAVWEYQNKSKIIVGSLFKGVDIAYDKNKTKLKEISIYFDNFFIENINDIKKILLEIDNEQNHINYDDILKKFNKELLKNNISKDEIKASFIDDYNFSIYYQYQEYKLEIAVFDISTKKIKYKIIKTKQLEKFVDELIFNITNRIMLYRLMPKQMQNPISQQLLDFTLDEYLNKKSLKESDFEYLALINRPNIVFKMKFMNFEHKVLIGKLNNNFITLYFKNDIIDKYFNKFCSKNKIKYCYDLDLCADIEYYDDEDNDIV